MIRKGMVTQWLEILHAQIRERRDPWVVLEGRHAVEAALAGWWEVAGVVASEESPWEPPVWSGLEFLRRSRRDLEEIAGYAFHRGVLGLAKLPGETGEVAKFLKETDGDALVVVCPRLADAANAGAIVRNAAAMGAAGVLFGAEGVSPFERKSVRSSTGSVFRLPVRIADGGQLLRSLLAAGFELLGADAGEGSMDIRELPAAEGRRALVIGAEDDGLGPFWRSAVSSSVRIPMAEGVDSLNAAAASAVLLWELTRGRPTDGA